MVAPGEWAEVQKVTGVTKDAVELGQLVEESEPTKAAARQRGKQEEEA